LKRKNKVIAFRVDASEEIGTGHLMRCLTLAEELSKSGGGIEIVFVSRDLPTPLQELIFSRGYFLKVLPNHPRCDPDSDLFHAQWLKVSQRQDALDTLDAIENLNIEWLVVDHYAIDYKWEEDLHARINNLAVIDDLADRHHVCELLIDQNF
jgi:UDP-2,4-diacetamido-2,4,6-trideoxy-beta-L-altropyranose hydrolase